MAVYFSIISLFKLRSSLVVFSPIKGAPFSMEYILSNYRVISTYTDFGYIIIITIAVEILYFIQNFQVLASCPSLKKQTN